MKRFIIATLLLLQLTAVFTNEFTTFERQVIEISIQKQNDILTKLKDYHSANCYYYDDVFLKELKELIELEREFMTARNDVLKEH